ncbi:DUF5809 family protein [Natronocalculus amylovorans]|uniref:DUF5809 family protein n=1 Tax=Natronocalculus amylovorans TaxID=2917812 RepID=A0AAE3K8A7_9EURY|nr:DUF5809 family protein [Natronocalculus amylovorans]MCL9816838.1 DUF5809 family protein [Natronocalculus amylovorans]NUE01279.1 hypothetical protein [Halorubraceae archaeon YAN]
MQTVGMIQPETPEDVRSMYEDVGPTAQVVVRETASAMQFDREEYADRITSDVIETARDALFASLLTVHHGTRAEFEAWCDDHPTFDREVMGGENVDSVVWHSIDFAETVVAATYQNEPTAAAGTLRRQVFGRHYRHQL